MFKNWETLRSSQ